MAKIKLDVITPVGAALSEEVDEVSVPGVSGRFGVYEGHRPGLSMLGGGRVSYKMGTDEGEIFIRGGVAEVQPGGVLILADNAEHAEDLDREHADNLLESVTAELAKGEFLEEGRSLRLAGDRDYAEAVKTRLSH